MKTAIVWTALAVIYLVGAGGTSHVPGTRSTEQFRGLYAASQGYQTQALRITTRRADGTVAASEVVL